MSTCGILIPFAHIVKLYIIVSMASSTFTYKCIAIHMNFTMVWTYTLYVNVEIYILFQNFQVPTLFSLK